VSRPPLYELLERIRFRQWFGRLYRVEIRGGERIPVHGGVVLVANHESLIDPWFLSLATPRPVRYMAKAELWRYPGLRWVMRQFGTFPIERTGGDGAGFSRAAELLAAGEALGMFPQGTCLPYRSRPFKRGAARLALVTGAPIVPVALVGTEKALRPGRFKIGLPRVHVLVGAPIPVERTAPTPDHAAALTEQIERAISALRAPFGAPAHAWRD
jgi:1-acyl-sn-glycerol-3-phosphate acyltransferase